MGGKTSTSTSGVSIPPSVLAQYNSVVAGANQTATNPFQTYGGQFVAPVNATQLQGVAGTTAAANEAQPYYGAATDVTGAAAAGTAAAAAPISGADINQYLSPYLGDVLESTEAVQNQENQEQQSGQLGNAITSGAFGSDRTGIAAANLEEQQNLANNATIANIANTGFTTAQGEANTEQQAALQGAGQLAGIGSELGALGTGAQTAGLTGAAAELSAGTVEQQTQQAQDTALYNQFLQQQSYPFQVGSWLAGISEGTGSLEGSTTTTTQPGGFFSDRRLKRDIKKIGKTYDGQDVVTYKMGDDERTHIGLIAQDVEKKHPEAVGVAGGFKTVDYGKATREAANEGHFHRGGVIAFPRKRYATGGYPEASDGIAGVLAAQQAMYGTMGSAGTPGLAGTPRVPTASSSGAHLAVSGSGVKAAPTGAQNLQQAAGLVKTGEGLYKDFTQPSPTQQQPQASTSTAGAPSGSGMDTSSGVMGSGISPTGDAQSAPADQPLTFSLDNSGMKAGGTARRHGFEGGGGLDIPDEDNSNKLTVAAAPPSQSSSQSGLGDVASIAGIVSAFMNQGGVVASRRKRDTGGQLDIPSDASTDQLATAAPLAVGPAQAEKNADMQDIADVAKIAGMVAMFAKRGGRIKGYADGGDPTGDPDPDDDSAAPPSAPAASGVAPADAPAATSSPSLWDKIKGVATNPGVLAALEGIGAMGTARTVHPGVALAAGLEAAAGAYPTLKEGLAQSEYTQAQARATEISNELSKATNKAAIGAITGTDTSAPAAPRATSATAPASSAAPATSYGYETGSSPVTGAGAPTAAGAPGAPGAGGSTALDPNASAAALDQKYQQMFATPPITPQEAAYRQRMYALSAATKNPAWGQSADAAIANRVQQQQFSNRQGAQREADALYQVATTDPNPTNKAAALAAYNAIYQQTGDTNVDVAGSMRNSRTNLPPIGAAAQQLTPEQQANLNVVLRGQNIGEWSVENDANTVPWAVNKITGQRISLAGNGGGSGGTGQPGTPPANALPGVDFNKLPQTAQQSGFATATSQIAPAKTEDFRASQLSDANDAATQDAKTQSIIAAAKNELAKVPARAVGPGSSIYNGFQAFRTAVTGSAADQLVDEVALDKYLSQFGAQNVRALLTGQKITNQEMMLFMERGSPNVSQPIRTINNLVNYLGVDTDYDSRLQATKIYALNHGADPWALPGAINSLPGANRADYVQARVGDMGSFTPKQRPGQAPTVVRTGTLNGRKVAQYSDGSTAYVD